MKNVIRIVKPGIYIQFIMNFSKIIVLAVKFISKGSHFGFKDGHHTYLMISHRFRTQILYFDDRIINTANMY